MSKKTIFLIIFIIILGFLFTLLKFNIINCKHEVSPAENTNIKKNQHEKKIIEEKIIYKEAPEPEPIIIMSNNYETSQIEKALQGSPLEDSLWYFEEAGRQSGINPLFLVAFSKYQTNLMNDTDFQFFDNVYILKDIGVDEARENLEEGIFKYESINQGIVTGANDMRNLYITDQETIMSFGEKYFKDKDKAYTLQKIYEELKEQGANTSE